MNYDNHIQTLIDGIKADKAITSEWRYKAISRLKEARAYIHEGKNTTNRQLPDDVRVMQFAGPITSPCICSPGMPSRKDCPMHGEAA